QVALSAFRWRFTAARLGIALPFRQALREYYLASFLNQMLPGGVVGDASRGWRHSRGAEPTTLSAAARAVILERSAGQIVVTAVAIISLALLPMTFALASGLIGVGVASVATALLLGFLVVRARRKRSQNPGPTLWEDVHAA